MNEARENSIFRRQECKVNKHEIILNREENGNYAVYFPNITVAEWNDSTKFGVPDQLIIFNDYDDALKAYKLATELATVVDNVYELYSLVDKSVRGGDVEGVDVERRKKIRKIAQIIIGRIETAPQIGYLLDSRREKQKFISYPYLIYYIWDVYLREKFDEGPSELFFLKGDRPDTSFFADFKEIAHDIYKLLPEDLTEKEWNYLCEVSFSEYIRFLEGMDKISLNSLVVRNRETDEIRKFFLTRFADDLSGQYKPFKN